MSAEIEAAGDLVTGAGIARAVEPGHGATAGTADSCLNCGARLSGNYCHVCGQKADVHRSLGAFWHDFLHSILHFEGKIWRTLPLLFFRPGELTRRYIHGERARFVSPLALFLFAIFLMFAVFSTAGLPMGPGAVRAEPTATAEARKALDAELLVARERVTTLERQGTSEASLAAARRELRAVEAGAGIARGLDQDNDVTVDTGRPALDAQIRKAFGNPQLLLYKMQSNGYKFSWALVILSLPFVWLVFAWKRQFHLFDHLVFATYSICFMTLLLVIMSLTRVAGFPGFLAVLAAGIPLHMFFQLRGAYTLSIWGAMWRSAFLLMSAIFVVLMFSMTLLAIGAFG